VGLGGAQLCGDLSRCSFAFGFDEPTVFSPSALIWLRTVAVVAATPIPPAKETGDTSD